MLRIFFIASVALVFSSCAKNLPYPFYDDWVAIERIYTTERDLGKIRKELVGFLGRAEYNGEAVKKESRLNYRFILAENWLRLAVISDRMGDRDIFEDAITHAISHCDQLPNFAADSAYQANKKEMLAVFLSKVEKEHPPAWRTAAKNNEPNHTAEPASPSRGGSS